MQPVIGAALIILTFSATAAAEVTLGQILPKTPPGGQVAIGGSNLNTEKKPGDYSVEFESTTAYSVPIEKVELTRLVVRVPGTFTQGTYLVYVTTEGGSRQFVGQIDIVAAAPQIHRVVPRSSWSKLWWDGQFDFRIVGERLCVDAARNHPSCPPDVKAPRNAIMPDTETEAVTLLLGSERLVLGRCTR